jgi:hypothetical protein
VAAPVSPPAKPTPTLKPRPKPRARPITWATARNYHQLFKPGQTIVKAATPLCASYAAVVDTWTRDEESLATSIRGADADPYVAADFVVAHQWVNRRQLTIFNRSITAISRKGLAGATKGAARRGAFVKVFTLDALFVCHVGAKVRAIRESLASLDDRAGSVVALAADKPWYPKGYTEFSDGLAWQWVANPSCPDYASEGCWQMDAISRDGCPDSLYGEITILQGDVAVDYTNDAISGIAPGERARLTFVSTTSGQQTGRLSKLDCY